MFPDRIEKAICVHENVDLCCVIGIADKERINYPRAYVVLKNKEKNDTAKQEIMEICKKSLPGYMIPDEIMFVDDMPRTSREKIDYRLLEDDANKNY